MILRAGAPAAPSFAMYSSDWSGLPTSACDHRDQRVARRGAVGRREPRIGVDRARRAPARRPPRSRAGTRASPASNGRTPAPRLVAAQRRQIAPPRVGSNTAPRRARRAARRAAIDRRAMAREIEQRELDRAQRRRRRPGRRRGCPTARRSARARAAPAPRPAAARRRARRRSSRARPRRRRSRAASTRARSRPLSSPHSSPRGRRPSW